MKRIGIIDQERLYNIPLRYHAQHEFCFHLHDLMLELLVQMEVQKAGHIQFELQSNKQRRALDSGMHILDFLSHFGHGDLERRAVINHTCIALYADMLHFIFEGLRALEKRKSSVAFSLFRKPFKEGMLLAAKMCSDEIAFFSQMKTDANRILDRRLLDDSAIKLLLATTLETCSGGDLLNADEIYETSFNRKNNAGLAGLYDKATHLITGYSHIRTENYNINFIFKNPEDNDVYQTDVYKQLAKLLLFLGLMQIELYSRMRDPNKKLQEHKLFSALAAFEALFMKGRSRNVRLINKYMSEHLECAICQHKIRLKKTTAPRFFVGEILDCPKCSYSQHFPLGWLLQQTDFDILKIFSSSGLPRSSNSTD